MKKNIRSKVVRESLLDYNTLAKSLEENSKGAIKSLLGEAVRDTYAKLLSEDDNEDYEEEEVEDTTSSDTVDDVEVSDTDISMEQPSDDEGTEEVETDVEGEETLDEPTEDEGGDDEDEWAEFDKYKVSDNEYDFFDAEDEDIVKVYKLMKNDDQILVNKEDNGNVKIQDNETGAEYLISLDADGEVEGADDFGGEDDLENDIDGMNESTERMFELVLEYDSNVGYTDNYQKKDVMTNPGMSEPGKNVNDWDAGVPKDKSKPWSGYSSKKNKADQPFNGKKGKKVEESIDECGDGEAMPMGDGMTEELQELKTVQQHTANIGSTSRTDGPDTSRKRKGRNYHTSKDGQVTSTSDNAYGSKVVANESALIAKTKKAIQENKELKSTLKGVMSSLKEAAVVNHNLAQIIKLVSENTTSQDEKKEIIARFTKEAKTIEQSKNLYESISRDLKKTNKMSITEGKYVKAPNKVNETTIYKSQDMLNSLDLMHRMM